MKRPYLNENSNFFKFSIEGRSELLPRDSFALASLRTEELLLESGISARSVYSSDIASTDSQPRVP
jgi:hypothetical protein